ncbi:MAG: CsbD family protein [Acidimicrobiales bacterium]
MSGEVDKAKGRVKEAAGDLTGDDDLKGEGKADRVGGEVKDKIDDVKDKAGDLVDGVKDKFTRD